MKKGFSLVEMAIVLVIMSVVAGTVMKLLPKSTEVKIEEINVTKIDEIQKAITAFANSNNMLPCPADITTAVNTSTFGVAGTNCNASISGDITVGSFSLRIGMVPVRTLNLPDDYAFDAWGNRIRYAVVKELAVSSTNFSNFATNYTGLSPNNYTFQIRDGAGNTINTANSYSAPTANNSVAYVLFSHGVNANGAVPFAGGTPPSCPASGLLDQENCNGDAIFRDTFFSTANSNYFDDYIRWKTYNQLRVEAGLAGSAASVSTTSSNLGYARFTYRYDSSTATTANTGIVGTPASNTWMQRQLNTQEFNNMTTYASFDSTNSRFTLQGGRYEIKAKSFVQRTATFKTRLFNITTSAALNTHTELFRSNSDSLVVWPETSAYVAVPNGTPYTIRLDIANTSHNSSARYALSQLFSAPINERNNTFAVVEVTRLGDN